MTPIHTMPPTRGTALSISTSSPEISKQETFTSVNITTKPDATTTLLKTLLTQSRVATDNSRNEGISNYKVTSGHSTKTESASKPTAIDVGTITTTENTTIEGTFGALYTTPLSPLVNTEFQTSVTSTSVPNVSSLSTDIALSFTNSSDFQTKNKPLVFLEESTSLITTAVPLISPTIATSGETILQSTETVSTNTTVPSSIKPSLTGNKRMIDTYAGTVAVASLGAASGSMVIGSAAYLILRKFACNKVSPTPADGYVAVVLSQRLVFDLSESINM